MEIRKRQRNKAQMTQKDLEKNLRLLEKTKNRSLILNNKIPVGIIRIH